MWVKTLNNGYVNLALIENAEIVQEKEYYYICFESPNYGDGWDTFKYHIYYETIDKAEKALDELMKKVNSY